MAVATTPWNNRRRMPNTPESWSWRSSWWYGSRIIRWITSLMRCVRGLTESRGSGLREGGDCHGLNHGIALRAMLCLLAARGAADAPPVTLRVTAPSDRPSRKANAGGVCRRGASNSEPTTQSAEGCPLLQDAESYRQHREALNTYWYGSGCCRQQAQYRATARFRCNRHTCHTHQNAKS